MPRQLQLNDSAAWESLRRGQFVVFLSDWRTDVVVDSDGKPAGAAALIPVFGNLPEAEIYAQQSVARLPSVCAAIYDYQGKSGEPVRRVYHPNVRQRFDPERSARRYAWTGGAFLCAFTIWAFIAANRSEEHFLWFYIVGVKLFTLGTVLFVRGIGFFIGRHGKK